MSREERESRVDVTLIYVEQEEDSSVGINGGYFLVGMEFPNKEVVEAELYTHKGEDGVTRAYVRFPAQQFDSLATGLWESTSQSLED